MYRYESILCIAYINELFQCHVLMGPSPHFLFEHLDINILFTKVVPVNKGHA